MTAVDIGADGAAPGGALDLAAVFAAQPGAAAVYAADAPRFTVLAASDALIAVSGRSREALVGRPLVEAFPGPSAEDPEAGGPADLRASLEAAVRSGMPQRMARQRYDLQRPDGAWEARYWDAVNTPVLGTDGVVRCVLHQTEDVTDQVRGEVALARAEHHVAGILARIADGYIVLDRDFRVVAVNPAAERALGRTRDELLGRTHWALFPTSVDSEAGRAYRRVVESRVEQHLTTHYVGDGYDWHLGIDAYPTDEGGVAIFWRDVTERVRAEAERERLLAEVAAERERLRDVVLQAPVPMALHEGPEHRYTLVNAAYRRVSGGGRDVTGLAFREAFPEVAGRGLHAVFDRVYTTGEPWAGPETHLHYDRRGTGPEDAWFDLRYEPVRDAAGKVTGILNFSVDVTDQVRARREVERLLAASEQARQAVEAVNAQLQDQQLELELANLQLQDNAAELEAANEELQVTTEELEERTAAAEDARGRIEAVLASVADPFYLLDQEWRFTHVNDAAEPLLQTTREALLGRTLWEAFPGVVGSVFEGPYREAMATGRPTSVEAYFDPLGTWFDVHSYPWSGGLMVHFRDVGARKAAEAERERLLRALEVERARLEEVFRRAPAFLAVYRGADHVFDRVNDAYYQLVGHGRDILGKPLLEALPEVRGQGFDVLLDRVLATGEPFVGREVPVRLARTPGAGSEERYVDLTYLPLTEADGTRAGVIAHGTDVTAQVLARRDVERLLGVSERARVEAEGARAEAEAANRAKSEFLAVMSHELRTPLNAIGGYAELIEMGIRGPVTPQQREDLSRIQRSQRHLLGLINEVLNYARIETGAVTYDLTDVPVAEAVAAAETLVAPQLRAKGLGSAWVGCDPMLAVRADRDKLQQILLNLLSNAVKFTHARPGLPGRIEVSCDVRADAGQGADARVLIHVRDTGVGIPPDKLGAIFEPFVQVDTSLTRRHEGTGLGLSISRDLARGMDGDLTAESTPGTGSTFTLALPRA